MAPRGKLLTRRVSIGDGAHRKKSHADGSSLFQGMSSVVGRSRFDPPNAAGGNEEHGKNRLVVTRNIRPCKGSAPQRIRLGTFVTISTGVRTRGNVKRQGRRPAFRGADAKRNCRATGAGPRITASSSIGFGLVSKHAEWRPPRKIHPRGPSVCKARRRVSGAVAATQSSKPGSMSSLHAAPMPHRREGTRKIVMTQFDFADQRDE